MTNPGPMICPRCGYTLTEYEWAGFRFNLCTNCGRQVATAGGMVGDWATSDTSTFQRPPASQPVDEPHANMPEVDGALLCCILDQDMSPTTLAGTLVWVYNLRGYSREIVESANHYRERGVRLLLANLWEAAWAMTDSCPPCTPA